MTTDTISLEFLAQQAKTNMDEMRQVREELADIMRLTTATYELTRRIEHRENELRDDVELMIKIELGGSLANIQTSIDASLANIQLVTSELNSRMANLASRL